MVTWEQVVSVLALILAVVAAVVGLLVLHRLSKAQQRVPTLSARDIGAEGEPPPSGPPAVVINPTKVADTGRLKALTTELCAELGLPEPLWLETTPTEPGRGQARHALAAGASVVIAAGGDGTVRAVASALAGTRTPMGLLPLGTGNLLARNLDLPLEAGARALLATALAGTEHPIDLGWVRPERLTPMPEAQDDPDEHVFLVMTGVGFDAAMVAGADDALKARMGWMAYFVAGARHLHGRKTRLSMRLGDDPPIPLKLRSLLVANCGRLPGGMVLLPDAEIDDGWLDIGAIDTRGGVIGWASLFGKVVMQGVGVRRDLPGQPGTIEFWRSREVRVTCEEPEPIQVDGDLIGEAVGLHLWVQPAALVVRTR